MFVLHNFYKNVYDITNFILSGIILATGLWENCLTGSNRIQDNSDLSKWNANCKTIAIVKSSSGTSIKSIFSQTS